MNLKILLLHIKHRIIGSLFPHDLAKKTAQFFLTPKRFPIKDWEKDAEESCERLSFGDGLSAVRWGSSEKKILIMHGWESRATQMHRLVPQLVEQGFEVIGIDAPGHGHSKGSTANPVAFAEAVVRADQTWGPFYGAIGHSMGAASLSIAMESGARLGRMVLISSPNNLHEVLAAFARFIGLSKQVSTLFIKEIEHEVGRTANDLDVGRVFAKLGPKALIIHAKNDREVPIQNHDAIIAACPGLQSYTSDSLGHRRIIQSPEIATLILRFMSEASQTSQGIHVLTGMDVNQRMAV